MTALLPLKLKKINRSRGFFLKILIFISPLPLNFYSYTLQAKKIGFNGDKFKMVVLILGS